MKFISLFSVVALFTVSCGQTLDSIVEKQGEETPETVVSSGTSELFSQIEGNIEQKADEEEGKVNPFYAQFSTEAQAVLARFDKAVQSIHFGVKEICVVNSQYSEIRAKISEQIEPLIKEARELRKQRVKGEDNSEIEAKLAKIQEDLKAVHDVYAEDLSAIKAEHMKCIDENKEKFNAVRQQVQGLYTACKQVEKPELLEKPERVEGEKKRHERKERKGLTFASKEKGEQGKKVAEGLEKPVKPNRELPEEFIKELEAKLLSSECKTALDAIPVVENADELQ